MVIAPVRARQRAMVNAPARARSRVLVIAGACVGLASAAAAQTLAPGSLFVGVRNTGTVLTPSADPLAYNGVISGRGMGVPDNLVRGTGPAISGAQLALVALPSSGAGSGGGGGGGGSGGAGGGFWLLARPALNLGWATYTIDLATGNRTAVAGSTNDAFATSGEMIADGPDTILALTDQFQSGTAGVGSLLRVRVDASAPGQFTLLSGLAPSALNAVGDGVMMHRPRALTRVDATRVGVAEFGPVTGSLPGTLLFEVDVVTGARTVVSTLSTLAAQRFTANAGVVSGTTSIVPTRGTGPRFDAQARGLAFVNGKYYVGGSVDAPFAGCILEVDPATGDRTLVGGTAIDDGGQRVTVAFAPGSAASAIDSPTAMVPFGPRGVAFVSTFGDQRVLMFDVVTRRLYEIANLDPQIAAGQRAAAQVTGLAFVPCGGPPVGAVAPAGDAVDAGACAGATVTLDGAGLPSAAAFAYQWEVEGAPGEWFALVDGPVVGLGTVAGSGRSRLVIADAAAGTQRVRYTATSACGVATSPVATVIVRDAGDPACVVCAACAADFDQDGGVTGADIEAFFAAFEQGATCGDVDQDGGITGADIEAFFAVFEQGGC
jgi:hypothetical protein